MWRKGVFTALGVLLIAGLGTTHLAKAQNLPPQVDTGGPYTGVVNQPVQFDASGTVDPDGDTLIFLWDFGDGSLPSFPSEDPTATHSYTIQGNYTATLVVTDGINDPVAETASVEISEPVDFSLDHFKCWQAKDLKNPKFEKRDSQLEDQFAAEIVEVKKPFLICAPADKDGSGIVDPATHICCYKIKGSKLDPPENVEIEDQWGTLQLEVKKPKFLCQPCSKTVLP
jgi:PKD repeat protein